MTDVYTPEFDPETGVPLRKVRSFVLREGRLTKGQERALVLRAQAEARGRARRTPR